MNNVAFSTDYSNSTYGLSNGGSPDTSNMASELAEVLGQLLGEQMNDQSGSGQSGSGQFGGSSNPAQEAFGQDASLSEKCQDAYNTLASKDPGAAQQLASAIQDGNNGGNEMQNVENLLENDVKAGDLTGQQAVDIASGGPASSWGGGNLARDVASNVVTGGEHAYNNTFVSKMGAAQSGLNLSSS